LEVTAKALQKSLGASVIPHAFLFFGPRGVGKTSTARISAQYINCLKPSEDHEPCGKCEMCLSFKKGSFLDLLEIDAASNRGIDDVRSLRERAVLSPAQGKYKIYIIDEAHMMTKEAFNALLKVLEEPPKHCIFILCTTEKEKLPPTIVSRCQQFSFKRARVEDILKKLQFIVKEEGAKVAKSDLITIAQESEGGFRDAENMLEQVIKGGIKVEDLLGGLRDIEAFEFLKSLAKKDYKTLIVKINTLYEAGIDLEIFLRDLLGSVRSLIYFKIGADRNLYEGLKETAAIYREISNDFNAVGLREVLRIFNGASGKVNKNPFPPLVLELAVLDYCLPVEKKAQKPIIPASANKSHVVANTTTTPTPSSFSWERFLSKIKPYNHSLEALLKSCQLVSLKDNNLLIEAFYPFHKEKLESASCQDVLKKVLVEDFGISCDVSFVLTDKSEDKSGEEIESSKTEAGAEEASNEDESVEAADIFDGAL